VLTGLSARLRPQLTSAYQSLAKEMAGQYLADLPDIAAAYQHYTAGDRNLNRPLLTLVGYGAHRDQLGPELLQDLGPLVFVPQLVRDFLAIHDDIVDGDLVKFDRPTLPAALGPEAALLTADLLLGVAGDLIDQADTRPRTKARLHHQVATVLRRTQQGQLTELSLADRDPASIAADVLVRLYADKAAAYCYSFPFEFGATATGQPDTDHRPVHRALEDIGTASQIVDDLAGNLPGGTKDTPGEVLQLRRTVLLTQLAVRLDAADPLAAVVRGNRATAEQAGLIREAFTTTGAAAATAALAVQLARTAEAQLATVHIGAPALQYLRDLVQARIHATLAPWAPVE
jgi:geranylgeranyl pyrophosphate synthase